jgi:uncharacterized protein YjiS (DUF1127 family)
MAQRDSTNSLFWRLVSWPLRVAEARCEFALLAGLDDRGLADIGLTRQDLRDATALALSEHPSSRLAERAREREALIRARRRPSRGRGSIAAE